MEQLEDLIIRSLGDLDADGYENARVLMMQGANNSIRQSHVGKSPAEIAAVTAQSQIFFDNIFNRLNIPLEIKLISEREFLFYKLAEEKNICPSLKSWKRQNNQFLIKYKKYSQIEILTEDKKELVIKLITQLHKMGIILYNLTKDNIVYNEYEGVKLIGFSEAMWIDTIDDEQFLLNNLYGPCSTIKELLELELKIVDDIFETDSEINSINLDNEIIKKSLELKNIVEILGSDVKFGDHFHSSDEEMFITNIIQ